jgi:hypothetical protein
VGVGGLLGTICGRTRPGRRGGTEIGPKARGHESCLPRKHEPPAPSRVDPGRGLPRDRRPGGRSDHPRSLDLHASNHPRAAWKLPRDPRQPPGPAELHRQATGEACLRRDGRDHHHAGDPWTPGGTRLDELPLLSAQVPPRGRHSATAAGCLRAAYGRPRHSEVGVQPRRRPLDRSDHDHPTRRDDDHGRGRHDDHHTARGSLPLRRRSVRRNVRRRRTVSGGGRNGVLRVSQRAVRGCRYAAMQRCLPVGQPGLRVHGHWLQLHRNPVSVPAGAVTLHSLIALPF